MEKKSLTIPVYNGDGISDEIMAVTKHVLEQIFKASGLPAIEWIDVYIGKAGEAMYGNALAPLVLETVSEHAVGIKGPTETPKGFNSRHSVNVLLRKMGDFYMIVRPIKGDNVDLVFIREGIEDLYAGIGAMPGSRHALNTLDIFHYQKFSKTAAVGIKVISIENTERLMRKAIEYAENNGRRKITVATKPAIMKETDAVFNDACKNAHAQSGADVELEFLNVDDLAPKLITHTSEFDMIVTQNVYGDILSSMAGAFIGGVGYCPGGNFSDTGAIFEATHGTAPDIAGKGIASPIALLMSAEMMLRYLDYRDEADALAAAVADAVEEMKTEAFMQAHGGQPTTESIGALVLERALFHIEMRVDS
jgi:isocitrate dehydrogenase (NAD+)